jgi:hypothetical protein
VRDGELEEMPDTLADLLVTIKKATASRELVVVAMIPKTVAFALGRLLARADCRFFTGTHLMHYDQDNRQYEPMRVRESQPTHSPVVTLP